MLGSEIASMRMKVILGEGREVAPIRPWCMAGDPSRLDGLGRPSRRPSKVDIPPWRGTMSALQCSICNESAPSRYRGEIAGRRKSWSSYRRLSREHCSGRHSEHHGNVITCGSGVVARERPRSRRRAGRPCPIAGNNSRHPQPIYDRRRLRVW